VFLCEEKKAMQQPSSTSTQPHASKEAAAGVILEHTQVEKNQKPPRAIASVLFT
jgi:hypothetical protein